MLEGKGLLEMSKEALLGVLSDPEVSGGCGQNHLGWVLLMHVGFTTHSHLDFKTLKSYFVHEVCC